jgi:uncharacterized protein
MIDSLEHRVADIVQAAGGRLVSRIRLQKIAYLLDQLGADSGFSYAYHHYGPYSSDLDSAVMDAEAFELVKEDFGHRKSDGARYSVFVTGEKAQSGHYEYLTDPTLRERVQQFAATSITVLELAATAHWLSQKEKVSDWKTEIRRRKGSKTEDGRLDKAMKLLADVGLPPAA